MTAAVPIAMLGMTAVGTGMQAISAVNQGKTQADVAMTNAKLQARERLSQAQMLEREVQEAEVAAQAERQAGTYEQARAREQGEAYQATQRALVGASGTESTGSPLLVMTETAKALQLDRLALQHASDTRAQEAEAAAKLRRYQAQQLREGVPLTLDLGRYQARIARQAGTTAAVGTILSGAGSMAKMGYQFYG